MIPTRWDRLAPAQRTIVTRRFSTIGCARTGLGFERPRFPALEGKSVTQRGSHSAAGAVSKAFSLRLIA
jgi:hypothetical protein